MVDWYWFKYANLRRVENWGISPATQYPFVYYNGKLYWGECYDQHVNLITRISKEYGIDLVDLFIHGVQGRVRPSVGEYILYGDVDPATQKEIERLLEDKKGGSHNAWNNGI